jgi:hypothetical protein
VKNLPYQIVICHFHLGARGTRVIRDGLEYTWHRMLDK